MKIYSKPINSFSIVKATNCVDFISVQLAISVLVQAMVYEIKSKFGKNYRYAFIWNLR